MNLQQEIALMEAGGPGSGRHKALSDAGFVRQPDTSSDMSGRRGDFEHYKNSHIQDEDHHIYVDKKTGAWTHSLYDLGLKRETDRIGGGPSELANHLEKSGLGD